MVMDKRQIGLGKQNQSNLNKTTSNSPIESDQLNHHQDSDKYNQTLNKYTFHPPFPSSWAQLCHLCPSGGAGGQGMGIAVNTNPFSVVSNAPSSSQGKTHSTPLQQCGTGENSLQTSSASMHPFHGL